MDEPVELINLPSRSGPLVFEVLVGLVGLVALVGLAVLEGLGLEAAVLERVASGLAAAGFL